MENELRTQAVKLSPDEQYQIRKSIVRMAKQGKTNPQIAQALDVSERHVRNVKKLYAEEGIAGIKPKRRGRRNGEQRTLTPEQEREIKNVIVDNYPEQLRLPGCMWTRNNIRDLIKRKYKIAMPLSTLGYYLQRWGFSVQRPTKRARKQDAEKIDTWLNEEYPGITKRAKVEKAEIFFGDETGIQNTANYAKGYAPVGKTPVVEIESKKMKINMLSAVSKSGKLRFVLYKANMNAEKLIDFMRRLVKDTSQKVFLILDNLRVHHSKKARSWLEKHKTEIEVFYLPPYAPEYNQDEILNSDLKRDIGNRSMPHNEQELEHNVRSHMKSLQINPDKIRSFFTAEYTMYAA
jgi:transposase